MRPVAVTLVVVALLAAPWAGACGDCCPVPAAAVSVSAGASCCGGCETTVASAPEAAFLLAAAAPSASDGAAPIVPAPLALPRLGPAVATIAVVSNASPPLSSPRPLRL